MSLPKPEWMTDEADAALRSAPMFVCTVTPAFVANPRAKEQIDYAVSLGKRCMAFVREDVTLPDGYLPPDAIRHPLTTPEDCGRTIAAEMTLAGIIDPARDTVQVYMGEIVKPGDEWREAATVRYQNALHAMQSGVAMEQNAGSRDGEAKHLRVGINSALTDCKALAQLLIAKGVFTEREYVEAVTVAMEEEKAAYEKRLSEKYGTKVTLG